MASNSPCSSGPQSHPRLSALCLVVDPSYPSPSLAMNPSFDGVIFWNVDKAMAWARKADGGRSRGGELLARRRSSFSVFTLCSSNLTRTRFRRIDRPTLFLCVIESSHSSWLIWGNRYDSFSPLRLVLCWARVRTRSEYKSLICSFKRLTATSLHRQREYILTITITKTHHYISSLLISLESGGYLGTASIYLSNLQLTTASWPNAVQERTPSSAKRARPQTYPTPIPHYRQKHLDYTCLSISRNRNKTSQKITTILTVLEVDLT
jgi:hypothetical protein